MISGLYDSTCVSESIDWSDLVTSSNYGSYTVSNSVYDDVSESTLPDSFTDDEYKQFLKENEIEEI